MTEQAEQRVTITNELGMHARPAMTFVELASSYPCDVEVARADAPSDCKDGKSIMHLMMLAATKDTDLIITARGEKADEAAEQLADLIRSQFGEASG